MKPIGTRGGPRGDDELPDLPPGLRGLRGVDLCRAALAATRPTAPPRTRPPRDIPPKNLTGDVTPREPEAWTPSSVLDDIPLPDEPPEEDWRR